MTSLVRSKKQISIILLLTISLLISGCWDRRELEDQAFVQAIGIDQGPQGQLLVTFRIAIPSKAGLGQTAGGGGGGEGSVAKQASLLTSVNAPTIHAAITLASGYINRELNLMHTKTIVFGEPFAREGVAPVVSLLARYRELRRNIFMCVTKGEAHDLLKSNAPDLEKSYAKWWEGVKMMQAREAVHPGTLFHEFVTNVETSGEEGVMIYMASNKNAENKDPHQFKIPPSFKEGKLNVKAGEIPRTGGNPVEFLGTAVFKGAKLVDVLSLDETRSLLLLKGNFQKAYYTFPDPDFKGDFISLEIKQGTPPRIKAEISGDKAIINVGLSLEGDLVGIQSPINYAADRDKHRALEKAVEQDIKDRGLSLIQKLQELNTDSVGFGDYVKRNFLTRSQWLKFNWPEKFKDARINIKVNFDIRRTGMQGAQPDVYK